MTEVVFTKDTSKKFKQLEEKMKNDSEPDTLPFENSSSVERDEKEVADFLARIDEMLDSGMYLEMEETLHGIRDLVSDNDCYTTKQLIAVDNIASFDPVENWR